jgi:hypothetical protein
MFQLPAFGCQLPVVELEAIWLTAEGDAPDLEVGPPGWELEAGRDYESESPQ